MGRGCGNQTIKPALKKCKQEYFTYVRYNLLLSQNLLLHEIAQVHAQMVKVKAVIWKVINSRKVDTDML